MKILIFNFFLLFTSFPLLAKAEEKNFNALTDIGQDIGQFVSNIESPNSFKGLLDYFLLFGVGIAVILAVFSIIYAGYMYMSSSDNGAKKEEAKGRIKASLGGLLLALGCVLVLRFVNPNIDTFNIVFPWLEKAEELKKGNTGDVGNMGEAGVVGGPVSGNYFAEFTNINNPDRRSASADGTIVLNGKTYAFRSGGFNNGYLPAGTYEVTISTNESPDGRRTADGMVLNGSGWSFNLNDAYDSRTGRTRTELRIHPDGNSVGTNGCVGIQGDYNTLETFYSDMKQTIENNGGKYTVTIGGK